MGTKLAGLCSGMVVVACVGPGAVWLTQQQDQALLSQINQALTSRNVDATVTVRGRVATIEEVDSANAEKVSSVVSGVPGVAGVTTSQDAEKPSSESSGSVSPTPEVASTSTSPLPSATPTPSVQPVPQLDPIFFEGGSSRVPASAASRIDELVAILTSRPELVATLTGHTDNGLTQQRRDALGLARAQSVKDQLVSRGISADRLTAENRGDRDPLGDNATEEGLALNRRVSIRLEVAGR